MRRWNGWGDEEVHYPLLETAVEYLASVVGESISYPDKTLEQMLALVPESPLPFHPLITTDPEERLRHARGQSLPDWIVLRSGNVEAFPGGVAYVASTEDIREIIKFAQKNNIKLIPYGGGTSVVGHINTRPVDNLSLTVDISGMNKLTHLDKVSLLATFGAGVAGPNLEGQLNPHGYTLGHFPQSFELSTLGGWIATRSCGQQSYHYGRIEDLFAGGKIETPIGTYLLPPFPASAAGPDLRHLVLGSEGRLGIITQATLRIHRLPKVDEFFGVFFHNWETGINALRTIAQANIQVSMLRLSDPQETETTLMLSGKENLVLWADRALSFLKYSRERCLLIFGVTGDAKSTKLAHKHVISIARSNGGLLVGKTIGSIWQKNRFKTPYLRNTLWEYGYALDTLESAVPWTNVLPLAEAITEKLRQGLSGIGERVLAFKHLSHLYPDGASIYVTYLFRRTENPNETLNRWKLLKKVANDTIVSHGGTISHQHGVGTDHAPYLPIEKGHIGMAMLEAAQNIFDPDQIMNPGKLLI